MLSPTQVTRIVFTAWAIFLAPIPGFSEEGGPTIRVSFEKIHNHWLKISPKETPVMAAVFSKYFADGKFLKPTASSLDAANPKGAQRVSLPLISFEAADLNLYLQTQARIGLLQTMLDDYRGPRQELAGIDPDDRDARWKRIDDKFKFIKLASDLDFFTINLAAFVQSESISKRCQYWEMAHKLGENLGFAAQSLPGVQLTGSWADYYTALRTFYLDRTNGFANIPVEICQFAKVNSRADTLEQIRSAVDTQIISDMNAATKHFNELLKTRSTELGTGVKNSQVDIPVRGLFALERGFRDSFDLLAIVRSDLLHLYTGESSLIGQLEKQKKQMKTNEVEETAQTSITNFENDMLSFLVNLSSLPSTKGLDARQSADLRVCGNLKTLPKEGQSKDIEAFQTSYRTCLIKVVDIYKALRSMKRDDAATVEFAGYLSGLASTFTP